MSEKITKKFSGRVVLVTGGNSGVGRATIAVAKLLGLKPSISSVATK